MHSPIDQPPSRPDNIRLVDRCCPYQRTITQPKDCKTGIAHIAA
ncbi:Uncharacterised protein [Mycobacteroides abscessus subsp. abscessus]|nr:Uncharacterised protein [Mycobacteroides abscessus subsp. abscessus]